MNTTNLFQLARTKKRESVIGFLKLAFKDFAYSAYLFGSYATGEFHGHSDVDILVSPSTKRLDSSIVNSMQSINKPRPLRADAAKPPRRQTGMTLIEIMIALLIGAFLLGGVLQIFIGSKQTYRMQENLFRLQENARFAMYFLSKDIRRAGLLGCPSLRTMSPLPNVVSEVPAVPPPTDPITRADIMVSGADSIDGNWNAGACGAGGNCIPGSDAISINYSENCGGSLTTAMANSGSSIQISASNTCNVNNNDALLVSNCSSADIFRSTSTGNSINHQALNNAYGTDAELFVYHAYTYFIRVSTSGDPGRSLWRLDNTTASGTGTNPIELIEGVEDMQILYGVDTEADASGLNGDGTPNYYVTASDVAATDWPKVISIRISLLVATLDDNVASQNLPYTFNGATMAPSDRKIRRVFNTTIALRNRLG
jgi:type IV pilus assembly protein PilW